ncbi:hypothetical protein BLNAU_8205 [Blattamonas nauphoetae]|uniref:Right handed beta helix domain-containing protein n=1 Tax=Blattamonas nauphoetae TaxID=2049346 RepID=A0ABQ9XZ31_9EUKA|nr:hypothetical protein BLNAU_8205 [Blattamonas nauphoetae]
MPLPIGTYIGDSIDIAHRWMELTGEQPKEIYSLKTVLITSSESDDNSNTDDEQRQHFGSCMFSLTNSTLSLKSLNFSLLDNSVEGRQQMNEGRSPRLAIVSSSMLLISESRIDQSPWTSAILISASTLEESTTESSVVLMKCSFSNNVGQLRGIVETSTFPSFGGSVSVSIVGCSFNSQAVLGHDGIGLSLMRTADQSGDEVGRLSSSLIGCSFVNMSSIGSSCQPRLPHLSQKMLGCVVSLTSSHLSGSTIRDVNNGGSVLCSNSSFSSLLSSPNTDSTQGTVTLPGTSTPEPFEDSKAYSFDKDSGTETTSITFSHCHFTGDKYPSARPITFDEYPGTVSILSCSFDNIASVDLGGAVSYELWTRQNHLCFKVELSNFTSCSASEDGGAMWICVADDFLIDSCLFDRCSTTDPFSAEGGGLCVTGFSSVEHVPKFELFDCVFADCQARQGGGIYIVTTIEMSVLDTKFERCGVDTVSGGKPLHQLHVQTSGKCYCLCFPRISVVKTSHLTLETVVLKIKFNSRFHTAIFGCCIQIPDCANKGVTIGQSEIVSNGGCSPLVVENTGEGGESCVVIDGCSHWSSTSPSLLPFVSFARSLSSPSIGQHASFGLDCVCISGCGLSMTNANLVLGSGPLFDFGQIGSDNTDLPTISTTLSASSLTNTTSPSLSHRSASVCRVDWIQRVCGSCVMKSTNHLYGTTINDMNRGGSLLSHNTTFTECHTPSHSSPNTQTDYNGQHFTSQKEFTEDSTHSFSLCTFDGYSSDLGGAIGVHMSYVNLHVKQCSFRSCHSEDEGGGIKYFGRGGSVVVSISESSFSGCSATNSAGSVAILLPPDVTISDCIFLDSSAQESSSGALLVTGGNTPNTNTISNCLFENCRLTDGSDKSDGGGAVCLERCVPLKLMCLQFRGCFANTETGHDVYVEYDEFDPDMIEFCETDLPGENRFVVRIKSTGLYSDSSELLTKPAKATAVAELSETHTTSDATFTLALSNWITGDVLILLSNEDSSRTPVSGQAPNIGRVLKFTFSDPDTSAFTGPVGETKLFQGDLSDYKLVNGYLNGHLFSDKYRGCINYVPSGFLDI